MQAELVKHARILIVDDTEANLRLLQRVLSDDGFSNTVLVSDSRTVLAHFMECQPDLILLDLLMPYLDGFAVMEQLRHRQPQVAVPILVLTADATGNTKRRALALGAKDFLTKPFDQLEALLRIRNLLETRFLHSELQQQNDHLELRVQERTHDLEAAQGEILDRLARAGEYRDDNTGQHTRRVSESVARLAQALSVPVATVEVLRRAASLHDIGKIGIADAVLLKPGKLTADEFEHMKTHTTIGARILAGSSFKLLQLAEEIALTHHERWDGRGYPRGLHGADIPLSGRIVAVADVFDALTHERPYKQAWSLTDALAEMERHSALQFEPRIVAALLNLYGRG